MALNNVYLLSVSCAFVWVVCMHGEVDYTQYMEQR